VAALLSLLAAPVWADGAIYRYEDERGVVHFTNQAPDPRYSRVARRAGFQAIPEHPAPMGSRAAYDRLIRRAAQRHGLPPALLKAVIHAESAFDPAAVSKRGAMGLMQLMPATARMLHVAAPFDAKQNIYAGSRYLRHLHDRYGSWATTLAAYNAGPEAVDRFRGIPPFTETRQYVRRVLSYYRRYHGDFAR